MTDTPHLLAENIKLIRELEQVTQEEFADECGISLALLSLIERAKDNVTLGTLELIAARSGNTIEELFSLNLGNTYYLIESEICIEGTTATTYGIGVISNYVQLSAIPDISLNRKKIEHLVRLCNKLRLSPVHLQNIAEDYCEE
jgi:transcriptional regulator with XRE-family HTH domain